MIGAIIGAVVSAASATANAVKGRKARKKATELRNEYLDKQEQENNAWYQRRYNENAFDRADAQAAITKVNDYVRERNQAAAGRQAVMGGTEESVAAQQERNTKAISDTASNIFASEADRKDKVEEQYMNRKQQLDAMRAQGEIEDVEQKNANTTEAIQGFANAGSQVANALDSTLDSKFKIGTDKVDSQSDVSKATKSVAKEVKAKMKANSNLDGGGNTYDYLQNTRGFSA